MIIEGNSIKVLRKLSKRSQNHYYFNLNKIDIVKPGEEHVIHIIDPETGREIVAIRMKVTQLKKTGKITSRSRELNHLAEANILKLGKYYFLKIEIPKQQTS